METNKCYRRCVNVPVALLFLAILVIAVIWAPLDLIVVRHVIIGWPPAFLLIVSPSADGHSRRHPDARDGVAFNRTIVQFPATGKE